MKNIKTKKNEKIQNSPNVIDDDNFREDENEKGFQEPILVNFAQDETGRGEEKEGENIGVVIKNILEKIKSVFNGLDEKVKKTNFKIITDKSKSIFSKLNEKVKEKTEGFEINPFVIRNKKLANIIAGVFSLVIFSIISYLLLTNSNNNNNRSEVSKPVVSIDSYDKKIDKSDEGYSIDFSSIKSKEEDIKVGKIASNKIKNITIKKDEETTIKVNPRINTEIVYGNSTLNFEEAKIKLKKTGDINAIIVCDTWNEESSVCVSGWRIAEDIKFAQSDSDISFSVKHFSAYAGAYLEIINLQSNLTQGGTWTANFQTYSQSDLVIEAVDGTNYPTDLAFQSISCGDTQIESSRIVRSGNRITVANYQCDGQQSNIKNTAVTSGRHWLSFTFGNTVGVKAHNWACPDGAGTLDTTCTVSTAQAIDNGDLISGTGNLIIASGGSFATAAGSSFTLTMGGNITIQSGGSITGNVTINAANLAVDSGGSINVNGKGNGAKTGTGAGVTTVSGSNKFGSGGGYGGNGGNNISGGSGGVTYGSVTQPSDFGSGGGGESYQTWDDWNGVWVTNVTGGFGGGAVKINVSGTTTINGTITSNGTAGLSGDNNFAGGGSGGSIWVDTGVLAGSGSVTANGGIGYDGNAGAGGGGRIVLTYNSGSISTKQAYGGGTTGYQLGGAGTIYTRDKDDPAKPNGDLLVSNNSAFYTNGVTYIYGDTTPVSTSETFDALTVRYYARYNIPSSMDYTLDTPTITGGQGGLIVNSGTMNYSGTTISSLSVIWNAGTLNLPNTTSITDTPITNVAGKTINFSSTSPITYSKTSGVINFTNSGTVNFSNSSVTFSETNNTYNSYLSVTNSGGINFASGSTLNFAPYSFVNNLGATFTLPTTSNFSNIKTLTNAGTITAASNANVTFSSMGAVDNSGTMTLPATQSITFANGGTFTNTGTISEQTTNLTITTVASGTSTFTHSGTIGDASLSLTIGGSGTTNFSYSKANAPWSFANLTVASGGILTHPANVDSKAYYLDLTLSGNLTVASGGSINADARGYASTFGNEAGKGTLVGVYGAGGGYGGNGGSSASGSTGGSTYGSATQPEDMGTAGVGDHTYYCIWACGYADSGGAGGGAIKFSVSGATTVNGTISANGGSGAGVGYWGGTIYGGGGSGGSIWIDTNTLVGSSTGYVRANGGSGYYNSQDSANSNKDGAGGGGRIAITYNSSSGTIYKQAYGGTDYCNQKGGAGTIFTKIKGVQASGDLMVSNHNGDGANTTQKSAYEAFDTVTIQNYAKYVISSGTTLDMTTLAGNTAGTSLNNSGTLNYLGSTVSGISSMTNYGSFNSNNLTTISGITTFTNSGTMSVNALATISGVGTFTNNQATLNLPALTSVASTGFINSANTTLNLSSSSSKSIGGTITNSGTMNFSGGALTFSPSTLTNNSGAAINLPSSTTFSSITTLTNTGTIAAASNASVTFSSVANVVNWGTMILPETQTITMPNNGAFSTVGPISSQTKNLTITTVASGTSTFTDYGAIGGSDLNLTIGGTGTATNFSYEKNTNWSFANLTIANGGVLTHGPNASNKAYAIDFTLSGNLNVNSGGKIDVNSKGYGSTYGNLDGKGVMASGSGSGAGHGGIGGNSSTGVTGGLTYDNQYEPTDIGSSGGGYSTYWVWEWNIVNTAGQGGGAVKLIVSGTTTINGTISANGNAGATCSSTYCGGTNYYGGGGSGGSILIGTNTLAGSASSTISANGGNGVAGYGGGGGGGIIAIYANTNSYAGTRAASPGTGYQSGNAGTNFTDTTAPAVTFSSICSTPGNGCTPEGIAASPEESWNVSTMNGTILESQSQIRAAAVSVKDITENTSEYGLFYNGIDSFNQATEHWTDVTVSTPLPTTSTNWSFDTSHIAFVVDHTYEVRFKSRNAFLEGIATNQFKFVNSPPTVSNVTASKAPITGIVSVDYDVTDLETSSTVVNLAYETTSTLSSDLSLSSASDIALSDVSLLPANGYMLLDKEIIQYTGKSISNKTLTGITRGSGSDLATHSAGTTVFIIANNVTGDTGTVVHANGQGVGKHITWNPKADINGLYIRESTIKVVSNDLSSGGVTPGESNIFEQDTKDPIIGTHPILIDATTLPATVTLDCNDDSALKMEVNLDDSFDPVLTTDYPEEINETHKTTIALETDPDTVYVKFQDIYGNETPISYSVTTPETPFHVMVQDTSNVMVDPHESRLFVAWKVAAEPVNGFDSYKLYRSTDSGETKNWERIYTDDQSKERTINYYSDSSVLADTFYYYRLVTEDIYNNKSYNSVIVYGNPNGIQDAGEGGGGVDTTPPDITGINASSVTTNGAVITWETNELSNSKVDYYTPPSSFESGFETEISSSMVDNSGSVGQHRVILSGLNPNTTYHFKVYSQDRSLNTAFKDKDINNNDLIFTTLSGTSITEGSVRANPVLNTQATITWSTADASNTYVTYSKNSDMSSSLPEVGSDDAVTSHSYTLNNLDPGTKYFFYVRSGSAQDNNNGENYSFETTSDFSIPTINFNPATGVTNITNTSASISWKTSKAATGKIYYKTSEDADYTVQENISLNYDHRADLTNLIPNKTYYFNLESTDENDNVATSKDGLNDYTLTTSEAADTTGPVIYDNTVTVTDTTPNSATITWDTDENSSSFIQYATSSDNFSNIYKESGRSDGLTITNHSVTIEGLTQETPYYFKVKSVDSSGNETVSDNNGAYFMVTSSGGPQIKDVTAIPNTDSAVITWNTDTPSDAYVIYSENEDMSNAQEKGYSTKTKTDQSVTLKGLNPGTTYYYKVRSTNTAKGVTTRDNGYSFIAGTDVTGPIITNIRIDSISYNSAVVRWATDEPSTSDVEYGTDAGSLNQSGTPNSNLNIDHSVTLTGLEPGTTYYFKLISEDGSGNESENSSASNRFITLQDIEFQHDPLSRISDVINSLVTDENAVITLSTDQSALCFAEVTTSQAGLANPAVHKDIFQEDGYSQGDYTKQHSIKFTGLLFSSTYYYKLTCQDNLGTIYTNYPSREYQLTTLPKQTGHVPLSEADPDSEPEVITKTDTEAIINLDSGTTADSKLCVEDEDDIDLDDCDGIEPAITGTSIHSYHVIGLNPNTTYYAKMRLTDSVTSSDTFTTDEISFDTLEAQVDHVALSNALHDTDPALAMGTDTEAIITFNAGTTTNSKLCYSTISGIDIESCEGEESTQDNKLNTFRLTGLTVSTTYFLKMKITDSEDINDSYTTGEISFTTQETQYGTSEIPTGDATAPQISGVSVDAITGESATITWITDEKANSLVTYEIEGSTFSMMAGDSSINMDENNFSTEHRVIINGLIPSTKHIFTAISYDVSGNIAQSSSSSFTTKSPSSLSSIKVVSKAMGEVLITWSTGAKTSSIVQYGTDTSYGKTKEDTAKVKEHEIKISDLSPGQTYHFRVEGKDENGNTFASSDITFEPKTPPEISNFKVDSITEHGATITFNTNVPTDSLVVYTDANNADNSGFQGKPDLTGKHEINLKNIASGTKFSIKVKVRDEDGNETEEAFEGFSTTQDTTPPVIKELRSESALTQSDKVQTIISWKTDEQTTDSILYKEGRNGEEKEIKIAGNPTTAHVGVVTSFKTGTVYTMKIKATDISGNTATSNQYSLITPKRKENIIQVIISNFQDIFGWVSR